MKINWTSFFTLFIVMVVVAYVIFDNIVPKLIFIIIGGLSGLIFAAEKRKECN